MTGPPSAPEATPLNVGVDINERQMAMAPKADALRMKLLEYLSPAEEALQPITTTRGFAGHEKFWAGIKSDSTPVAGGEPD